MGVESGEPHIADEDNLRGSVFVAEAIGKAFARGLLRMWGLKFQNVGRQSRS